MGYLHLKMDSDLIIYRSNGQGAPILEPTEISVLKHHPKLNKKDVYLESDNNYLG